MNVSAALPTRIANPRPLRDDPPAPAPPPAPDIDFTTIDTPQKAILLPAIAANTFELLLNTTAIAGTSGVTSFHGDLAMKLGNSTTASLTHSDTDPTSYTLNGSGTMGAAPFQETWQFTDDALSIEGTIGTSKESLKVTAADDGLRMDGTIGSVEVHQKITIEGEDVDQKLIFHGTIGDQKFIQVRSYVDEGRGIIHDHVEGKLGDSPINYDQHWSQDDGANIAFATKGTVAGVPIETTHAFEFVYPPDPDPPT